SLFTTYRFPFGLELGYGVTYQGSFALNNRVIAGGVNTPQFSSDDYLIHRLFVSYPLTDNLTAQLNVQNVTDALYYSSIRNNVDATSGATTDGGAAPAEARSAVVSIFYSFCPHFARAGHHADRDSGCARRRWRGPAARPRRRGRVGRRHCHLGPTGRARKEQRATRRAHARGARG